MWHLKWMSQYMQSGQQHNIKLNNFLLYVPDQTLKIYTCLINRGVNNNSKHCNNKSFI